jgi:hypothetical protein
LSVRFPGYPIGTLATELGQPPPLAIPKNERLLVAVAHSKAAVMLPLIRRKVLGHAFIAVKDEKTSR